MVRWCWVNFQCRGVLLIWIIVGQGPTVLAVGAGGGCLDIFSLAYHFSFLSPSLWETARYRLKYCLKGPLSPKQPTNLYFLRLSTYPFSLFSPPPTAPANADLALYTKLFPTILRHEFISITKGNTHQIVFVSFIYFSFSYLPIRRFDRQEKPVLTGPTLHVWGTFGSEGEEKF